MKFPQLLIELRPAQPLPDDPSAGNTRFGARLPSTAPNLAGLGALPRRPLVGARHPDENSRGRRLEEDMANKLPRTGLDGEQNLASLAPQLVSQGARGIEKPPYTARFSEARQNKRPIFTIRRNAPAPCTELDVAVHAIESAVREENIAQLKRWWTFDDRLDMTLLGTITGMQNGRGMPTREDIDRLESLVRGENRFSPLPPT